MTNDDLATFRARFSGCELVMLTDISTRTILGYDSAVRHGQEDFDALCDTACQMFAFQGGPAARAAILCKATGARVFVRSPREPAEVMCSIFASTDLPADVVHLSTMLLDPATVVPP